VQHERAAVVAGRGIGLGTGEDWRAHESAAYRRAE